MPVMASEAFCTWSAEQLKSVKSGHWMGRCIVTAEIGSTAQSGEVVERLFVCCVAFCRPSKRCWRRFRTSRWTDLGREAKSFKVGIEKMP